MSTPSSNAVQYKNALLRAMGLVVILMALAGFTVSRFQLVEYYKNAGTDENQQSKMNTLATMLANDDTLRQMIAQMEAPSSQIVKLDKECEQDSTGTFKWQIEDLEKELFALNGQLKKKNLGDIATQVANAYDYLHSSRLTIRKLRNRLDRAPSLQASSGDPMLLINMKIEAVAIALDKEAGEIETTDIKGWFTNKKNVQEKLNKIAQNLKNLAGQLRSI